MIANRENQRKSIPAAVFTIVNPAAAEITACRLRQFLNDTIGTDASPSDLAWMDILPPTHDRRFVDNLSRAFPGIPLSASDLTSLSLTTSGPGLFSVTCGQLTLVCVVGPRNGAADACAFLPLWASRGAASESPPWLFGFDADEVIRALEDLLGRQAPRDPAYR